MAADRAEPGEIPRLGSVFGRYRLDALVGRGGMGVVFRATDLSLQRPVALKFLSPALPTDQAFKDRFVRESRLAAAIEHPAIVPVYEAGAIGDNLYIAMRFVPGRDLGAILRLDAPLGVERTIHLADQVAGALDAAHERGLVHRDVKPANVLVEQGTEERAYLADFGLSRRLGDLSAPTRGGPLGTVDYIAPEIVQQGRVDGRADQYALACVAFHCLTGAPPYAGTSDASVLFAHLQSEVPRASAIAPGLPVHVDEALMRALSKSPDERFPDCRSFTAALAGRPFPVAALENERAARTPVPMGRTRQLRTRRRLSGVVLVVGLATIVAAVIFLAVPGPPAEDELSPEPSTARVDRPSNRGSGLAVRPGEVIVFSSDTDGDYDLFALDASGKRPRRLTNTSRDERSPSISPDGATIAYAVGLEPRRDIWLMDADGRRQRPLVTHAADDSAPAWSSDGKSLAFHSGRNDPDLDIFEIRDRGSGLQQKNARARTSDPAAEQQPSWAPGSRRMVIAASYSGGYRDIFVIDLDDPRLRLQRTETRDWDLNPAFSPKGGAIAFTRRTFCPTCVGTRGTADVYMIELGKNERPLTSTPARDEKDPAWSPDGRALAYVAGPGDATELYAMTPDGKRSRQLLDGWILGRGAELGADASVDRRCRAIGLTDSLTRLSGSDDPMAGRALAHPVLGFYGPETEMWRINREAVLLGSGPAALLLQIAHPLVAEGVAAHSDFRSDPFRRLRRTLRTTMDLVFGDGATAEEAVRRLNGIHAGVRGDVVDPAARDATGATAYRALAPELLLWVQATLIVTSVRAYERWVGPIAPDERERFWQEARTVGTRMGIPHDASPPDWSGLEAWFGWMLGPDGPVTVTPTARALAPDILRPPLPFVPGRLVDLAVLPGLALLPPRLRDEYGIAWSETRERIADGLGLAVRAWVRVVPRGWRAMPQARSAERRAGASRDRRRTTPAARTRGDGPRSA